MAANRWSGVVCVLLLSSCEPDRCALVECRQPASSVCLSDTEMESALVNGTCEQATGECSFRTRKRTCNAGERCLDGACRCVPSLCEGCCQGDICVPGEQQSAAACGLDGRSCTACEGVSVCSSGDCTSCPPRHVVRQNVCVDDDVTVELSMPGALASWSDAGVTLWHAGPLNAATVHAAAVSARASLNDAGTSSLDFPVSLVSGHAAMTLGVRAPSGRTAEYALNVLVTRGISETPCFLTATNELDCSGERLDAGTFVGVGGPCGLNTAGEVWCRRDAGWQPAFPGVAAVVDVSPPCVRTLDGRAVCETDAGLVTRATDVRNLECRAATCCALNASGEATCWGRNEYRLFAGTGPNFNPFHEEPVPVPNLPGQYARLTSGGKTFFAMTEGGIWTAATNGMGFPTAPPFVLTDATADTLKLESPYYCIVGLEADGGTWWVDYTYPSPPPQRLATDAGPVIDVAPKPGTYSTFRMLTTERGYVEFDCHR